MDTSPLTARYVKRVATAVRLSPDLPKGATCYVSTNWQDTGLLGAGSPKRANVTIRTTSCPARPRPRAARGPIPSEDQREAATAAGAEGGEVPVIEREDPLGAMPVGEHDEGGVGDADVLVTVAFDDVAGA
jgi:hypothetical protein